MTKTAFMTNYKFGDVVLVPFPFSNLTQEKKRPAVVISSENYQAYLKATEGLVAEKRVYKLSSLE